MQVEKVNKDQLRITVSSTIPEEDVERLTEYITYLECGSQSTADQDDADKLAEELNQHWWKFHKDRFIRR